MTAREAALRALYEIDANGTYMNAALSETLRGGGLSAADRSLASELIYGVTINKLALDYIISKFSKIKIKKMTPWVLNILRMGIFQIYFMDKIPESAACNEAVKLAKKYSHRAGTGFVNGVLRSFARSAAVFEFPKGRSAAEELSIEYSYPLWITEKIIEEYGEGECRRLFAENSRPHRPYIRVNTLKTDADSLIRRLSDEGVKCEKTELANCLTVENGLNVNSSKAYSEGLFSLQNISSQLAAELLEPEGGEFIIDMCAAPGGKSCAIAERMGNTGKIIAFDIFEHKIELIKKSAKRLGIDIIEARTKDSRTADPELLGKADRVLADVPCSGLGVIHKKPDIKYSRSAEDIAELCEIQRGILENACGYVKDGGVLVYSTCTILPEENRKRIAEFLERHSGFSLVSESQLMTTEKGESGFYMCKLMKGKN